MATSPITLRGAEKLKEELHRLKTVDRPWVIQAIAEARAQGVDAEEALRIGLVREVAPHAELMDRARALAARIACNPPLALRYMKEGLRRAAYGDPREMGGWAIETIRTLMKTEDHREGVASFLEKRPPVFTGR